MQSHLTAVIAGAGIGGLTAAIALRQKGFTVTVCEQSQVVQELGAGLQLQASALRVFAALGLAEDVLAVASIPQQVDFREAKTRRLIIRGAPGNQHKEFPLCQLHRADLHSILLDKAVNQGVQLQLGSRVGSVSQNSNTARLLLEDGKAVEGDLVIGADGINSVVRAALFGETEAQFTGNVAYRAMIDGSRLRRPAKAAVLIGPNAHFVIYPLRGGEVVNIVAQQRSDHWTEESWTTPGDIDDLRRVYAGWDEQVDELLDAMEATYKWALYTRPAMPSWSTGRIGLIGDACHSALPNLGAGAAMAIEDGFLLAELLARKPDNIEQAFNRFFQLRIDRCSRVQRQSRRNSELFHMHQPAQRWLTYRSLAMLTKLAPGLIQKQLRWLQDYDPRSELGGKK